MDITTITALLGSQNYRTTITDGTHQIIGDEPEDSGGLDTGLDPYKLVLAGLALCKAATLRMYAQRKGWDLGEIKVHISLETDRDTVPHFRTHIHCSHATTPEQRQRLVQIADKCPTHKLLHNPKTFETYMDEE